MNKMRDSSRSLSTIYYDTGSRRGIMANKRKLGPSIQYEKVRSYVQNQKSNQLLRRRPTIKYLNLNVPTKPFEVGEADLAIMDSVEYSNRRFKYWLQYLDRSTRYLIIVPMKKKDTPASIEAFRTVFNQLKSLGLPLPKLIHSDQGSEFISKPVIAFLNSNGIENKFHQVGAKVGAVESSIRTIKDVVGKHFVDNKTANWIDVIDKIVDEYNNTYHSTIRMTPNEALKRPQQSIENIRKWAEKNWEEEPQKFKEGQLVRIRLKAKTFKKGYSPIWSDAVHKIERVIEPVSQFRSNRYLVEGQNGTFLYNDLLPIDKEETNPNYDPEKTKPKASVDKIKRSGKNELKQLGADLDKFDDTIKEGRQLRQRKRAASLRSLTVNYSE